jgi:hypothetical protein
MPAFLHASRIDGTGPMPMIRGSTPLIAHERIVASGFRPDAFARAAVVTITAAPPSTMPDALPAVTVPSLPNAARSFESASIVVSGLMWSSWSITTSSLPRLTFTPTISAANLPAFTALAPSACERYAYSSCASRVIPYSFARFSAVCAMKKLQKGSSSESKRASSSFVSAPKRSPSRRPRITCGACDIDSNPPAATHVASLSSSICDAVTTLCRPEPQMRFTVSAGTVCASPA